MSVLGFPSSSILGGGVKSTLGFRGPLGPPPPPCRNLSSVTFSGLNASVCACVTSGGIDYRIADPTIDGTYDLSDPVYDSSGQNCTYTFSAGSMGKYTSYAGGSGCTGASDFLPIISNYRDAAFDNRIVVRSVGPRHVVEVHFWGYLDAPGATDLFLFCNIFGGTQFPVDTPHTFNTFCGISFPINILTQGGIVTVNS